MARVVFTLLIALIANPALATTLTIDTDTSTELRGSFEATDAGGLFPVGAFGSLLPTGDGRLFLSRREGNPTFGTLAPGNPDFAVFQEIQNDNPRVFSDLSGMFNNNPSGTTVYFLFYDLADTGGFIGSFTGKFAYSTLGPPSPSPVPLPAAAWFMLTGLIGLFSAKRLKAT